MTRSGTILDSTGKPIVRRVAAPRRTTTGGVEIDQVRRVYGSGGYGYHSARVAVHDGRTFVSSSGDHHLRYDRAKLLAQSRDFLRNNPIYTGMIERAVAYIVGNGFGLRVRTSSKNANKKIEGLWRRWFKRPEVRNLLNGGQVSRMVCRELLAAGDEGVIKTDKATIRLIEAEQIAHPKLADGIDKDVYGTPTFFHICPYSDGGQVAVHRHQAVRASDFLFIVDPKRPSQTRGVPALQASFPMIDRLSDICDSEAVSWQLLARFAVAIMREGGSELGYSESAENDEKTDSDSNDTTTRMTELDYALLFHGNPGEEIKGIERNIPGKDFPQSVRMFLRLLGLPLGLPLEIILLDWTQSNYSQSRAVLEQAFETFQAYQEILEGGFYQPLFDWKIEQWAGDIGPNAMKELRSGVRSDGAPVMEWIRPTFPWLDQLKEAQAQAAKLDRSLTTHGHVCKSLNLDRDDVVATRRQEVEEAIQIAQQIEKKFPGVTVDWRLFAGLAPAGSAPTPFPADDEDKPNQDDEENQNGRSGQGGNP